MESECEPWESLTRRADHWAACGAFALALQLYDAAADSASEAACAEQHALIHVKRATALQRVAGG